MSTTPTPLVATPPIVPTATTSVTSATPSSSPTSTTPTSPTPVTPTTSSPASTSPVTSQSSSSSSSSSSSGSTSVPPSTTSSSTSGTTSSTSSTTPPTSQSSSSSSSISYVLQTSNGQVYTLTSFVTENSSPTQPPTSSSSSNNSSFIHNKAAVAGVFSVVGVCTVILAFFLFTSYLRRRRAREFDREIEEAAAVAATARPPDFDDYDYGSAAGGYGHYSETSHGTLSQVPLSHDQPRNDQSRSQEGSYAGAGVSGAAGIGARGRSVRNGGQQDPYAALSNPPEQYEMHETGRSWQQGTPLVGPGGTNFDILQAAGLSSSDPYAVTRGASTRTGLTYGQNQSGTSGLTRSQSQGTSTLPTTTEGYSMPVPVPTPAPVYPGAQDTAYVPNEKARYSASYAPGGGVSTMPPDVDEDAYDGYQEQPSAALNNPHSPGFAVPRAGEDADEEQNVRAPYSQEREEAARVSLADDEDYAYTVGQRVLRVANE